MTVNRAVLFQRGLSTVILWAAALYLIFSGSKAGSMVLVAASGLLAQWEFYQLQEEKKLRVFKKWGVFCGLVLYAACWYLFIQAPQHAAMIDGVEQVLFVALTTGVLVRLVLFPEPMATPIVTVALTLFGFFYVPFLFSFLARLAFWPGGSYQSSFILLYLLAVTKFCDAGAYAVGSFFGSHKMIPRISPGKTWEGFVGGLATSMLASVLLAKFKPFGGLPGLTLLDAVWLGILLSLASVVGDLAESVVKRDAHIKDSGHFIPGIGGALDLIDSLLFTAPVFYFYVRFVLGL